jgi:hypothetical protein
MPITASPPLMRIAGGISPTLLWKIFRSQERDGNSGRIASARPHIIGKTPDHQVRLLS